MATLTQKAKVTAKSTKQVKQSVSIVFQIGKTYKTIRQIAVAYNANYRPRKGFMYLASLKKQPEYALWCIHLNNAGVPWDNTMSANGQIITEMCRKDKTVGAFKQRVVGNDKYDPALLRLTFVKVPNGYTCVGVFRVVNYDFKNKVVVFERVNVHNITGMITRTVKFTIEIEEKIETIGI